MSYSALKSVGSEKRGGVSVAATAIIGMIPTRMEKHPDKSSPNGTLSDPLWINPRLVFTVQFDYDERRSFGYSLWTSSERRFS